ncbi:PREDICTED: uncharacterized protein LOC108574576 [Habropoda laboriosa]|nr:PREDICTED: uncharacterized protein LOC108574576 [Habropoda laboriosa]XP_017792680.1 PREDICTED: uncharacterized protein LOC108574576 [Habropoda laboriosa]XP_017792681.1 PREDICTED: uncharacterized protein LOC108574576 [Habropoda laboriosa]
MKPQKKAAVARKATKMPTIAKKRRSFLEKSISDIRKEKKSKKLEKVEDVKKKIESEKKKSEKIEEKKKIEDKKKLEEKRKEKSEKVDEKKKYIKDHERKWEKTEEKKLDKMDEKITEEYTCDGTEKKKVQKIEEKAKVDKQVTENKKKIEKVEDKKKNSKLDDENVENQAKILNNAEENDSHEEKLDTFCFVAKKKCKDEKKKDTKLIKPDIKEGMKISVIKDKKTERKKLIEKGTINTKSSLTRTKKDSKAKSVQKKGISRKTVLVKKTHLSVVQKLVDKKIKLNKLIKDEEASVSEEDEAVKRTKRKNVNISKSKVMQEKKPKLAKHMKAKLPSKNNKISTALKKDDKLKTLVEKVVPKKKLDIKETEKSLNEHKKVIGKDESNEEVDTTDIKSELEEDKDIDKSCIEEQPQSKSQDMKKSVKSTPKIQRKVVKKKAVKVQMENINQIFSSSEEVSSEEPGKQIKVCEDSLNDTSFSKQEQIDMENIVDTNLKDEPVNRDNTSGNALSSDSEDESDDEVKKNKQKDIKKREGANSPSDERVRRMRLFGFWSGPKRHRVASLNALAKVHCLYENETGGVYLGGFCKPKPEKEKQKKTKEEKEEPVRKEKEKKVETKVEENVSKRKLRNVPGLRGKHWDMLESSSSSSSSDEDCEREKNVEHKKKIIKRRKKNEEVMDLKDMVVCKRMASLNATAILAASYSDEKNRCGSSSDSSSESEVEIIKKRKQNDSDIEKRKSRQNSEQDDVLKPSNKLVIVNQDTDVTITGVYVNQTRSTHHEGFCSIAGMQYRISSTSHTQTAATAVATELHDQQKLEQPCKSYTPLGALSSMQPPGTQGNHPNMSPRRHSAFSAPHQHGYYQPAGPLIQHPPTLPPIKGPPPEPTPTPPQNSEGSDDLVATSTTSGGTSSTGGGFYRAYCPQYYGTPPQYPDLCYPPTYSHPHTHPPPYYKYAPTYRRYFFRQYYGYQESGGGSGPGSGATAGGPAVVDYQAPPPPPGDYPLPPYYGAYPPPPPPPPPPPNPAYLHSQGRPFVDHAAFQGCPCPMQSCPKNVDTGPLIGNGKGAPVVSGPGLSLPPSALVGPPSPARGLAGLAPPHGANAWDTDRVQLNTHRNLNQNQPSVPPSHNLVGGHNRPQNSDCKNKDEKDCAEDKLQKCGCQKHACTSTCEVKMETLSPTEKLAVTTCPSNKFHNFKLENNNVKCESCSVEMGDNLSCVANCNVKCESDYKCDIMKCEQCMKERNLEIDKDSGILLDDKLDTDPDVKEELSDVVAIDNENWKKPDYEPTVQETIEETVEQESIKKTETEQEYSKCQKVSKRKLSLDSLSDSRKKRKVSKRTLSVGSSQDLNNSNFATKISIPISSLIKKIDNNADECVLKKKHSKKDNQNQKRKIENSNFSENTIKKSKTSKQSTSNHIPNCLKHAASDNSIMETINNVIQQSLQMTQKKDRKNKNVEKSEKAKQETNLLSAVKKVVKKVDLVKELASMKFSKVIAKNGQSKNKTEIRTKSKTQEKNKCKGKGKSKAQEAKTKDNKKQDSITKFKANEIQESAKKSTSIKKKRKNVKKAPIKKSNSKIEDCLVGNENLILTRKTFLKPKWSNGWSWEGDPFEAKVYLTNEESAIRRCYASMKHESGDVLRPRDCVLLKSGPRKADLPFVAKIAALWENPDDGEMMFSLLWYYRPEHTEQGRTQYDTEDEVFASRHRDANSVACIEDKCYILTFNEYCRYRKNLRRIEEGLESPGLIVPPGDQLYPRENRQPPIPVPSDMVLFCRRVYDYRGKKLVKNPG